MARGDTEQAKIELRQSLQTNPRHAESHFLLASLLSREGNLDEAMVGFERTMALEPSNAMARYNAGTILLWRGEPVAAARLLEEAVTIAPDHVPSYINLAKAYFLAGLPELAVAGYQEALRLDPDHAVARRNLAMLADAADLNLELPPSSPPASAPTPPATPEPQPHEPFAPIDHASIETMRQVLRGLPHVTVEQRGEHIVLDGWTSSPGERALLDRVVAGRPDILDLTSVDSGDPHRLIEIDAIVFLVIGLDSESAGHNFLRNVNVATGYFAGDPSPALDWFFSASVDYQVNIANAQDERIAFLARPHLTTLSGSPATFIAGGDVVFRVSGTTSGDIKIYPFGTTLEVTPTLLRTVASDGTPLVRLTVKAGRKSILPLESAELQASGDAVAFSNLEVTSEAVLGIGQTLVLSGLSQREASVGSSGVPILKDIPLLKYLFSTETSRQTDSSVVILLTPRDPAYMDAQNRKALGDFIEMRRATVEAINGTEEDRQRLRERYPDWDRIAPNRFATQFYLINRYEVYRKISGLYLEQESLDLEALEIMPRHKDMQ